MSNQKKMIETEEFFLDGYDKYADEIFRHLSFRVFNRDRVKDLLQETFSRTWEYLTKGREIDNLRAFLYKVANNLIIDEVKKKNSLSLEELSEAGFQIEDFKKSSQALSFNLEYQEAIKEIKKLDEDYKQVVIMRYVEELSIKEISKILRVSENLVSVRLNRALNKLRQVKK